MSPLAGPTIAEPVSWAIISRRNGRFLMSQPLSRDEERAAECVQQPVDGQRSPRPCNGTLAAAIGPDAASPTGASRKKMKERFRCRDLVDAVRIVSEPGADRLHGHRFEWDLAQIGKHPPRPGKGLPGFGRHR